MKSSRRESEALGEEVWNPKKRREANDMNQVDAEEVSFVPSAISVPPKPLFRCDNQCTEKNRAVCVGGDKGRRGIIHDPFLPPMLQQVSGGERRQTSGKMAAV